MAAKKKPTKTGEATPSPAKESAAKKAAAKKAAPTKAPAAAKKPVAKKPEEKNPVEQKRPVAPMPVPAAREQAAPKAPVSGRAVQAEARFRRVQETAYYIAEASGWTKDSTTCWLEAEARVSAQDGG